MSKLLIRPLKTGVFPNFDKSIFTGAKDAGQKIYAPCFIWLIEGAERKVLVDTGPCGQEWALKYHYQMEFTKEDEPGSRLAAVGVDPGEIDIVVLSHLHWDHCFNVDCFKRATFYVQEQELRYAIAPLPEHRRAYEVDIVEANPRWFAVFNRIKVVEGDQELLPGISLITLPGHSPGMQGVLVDTPRGKYLIASDALPLFENWEGDGETDHILPGISRSLEDCLNTFAKIEKIADYILPGHDQRVLDKEIYGN